MYALVHFEYNEKIDRDFVDRFFVPCPKVGGLFLTKSSTLVVFKWHADELSRAIRVFMEPGGLFNASCAQIVESMEPREWQDACDQRVAHLLACHDEHPPCGSHCQTFPQYRTDCRGCPTTPSYLGNSHELRV